MPRARTVVVFFVAALSARAQSAYFSLTGESSFAVLSATTGANTARFITTLRGLNYVTSPDRTIAYVASQYESVVVAVDLETGRRIGTLGPSGVQPAAVAISPDGATLYCANLNNTMSIIDVTTGATLKNVSTFRNHPGVGSLAVTPDGTKAYISANGLVFAYDLVTGESDGSLGIGGAQRIALSPAGDRLYVPAQNAKKLLNVVDTATDAILFYISSAADGANDVAVSADGSTLYIAATKGLTIASAATGTVLGTIPSHALRTVALSPNELAACAVSDANPALVLRFDLVSNTVAGVSSAYGTGVECGYSSDGNRIYDLLTPDNNLVVQNTVAQHVTRLIHGGAGSPPSISRDGKTLVEPGTNFLAVFDTITKRQVQSAPYSPASRFNLAVSNDGTVAFVPSGLSPFAIDEIDLTSGTVIRSIPLPSDAHISDVFVTLSPDGNTLYFLYFALQGTNYSLNLCAADVATGSLRACQQVRSEAYNTGLSTRAIAGSADGSRLYVFTSTQTVGEFDTTLNLLRTLQIPANYELISLVFSTSANSLYLAATDSSNMLGMLMWVNPQTFTISSQQNLDTPINDVAVSADGSSVYVATPQAASPGVFHGITLTPLPGAQAPGYSGSVVAGPY